MTQKILISAWMPTIQIRKTVIVANKVQAKFRYEMGAMPMCRSYTCNIFFLLALIRCSWFLTSIRSYTGRFRMLNMPVSILDFSLPPVVLPRLGDDDFADDRIPDDNDSLDIRPDFPEHRSPYATECVCR